MLPPLRTFLRSIMVNLTLFFNIAADSEPLGHVSFERFADKVLKTAENFHALRTEEKGFGYKGSCSHRIILGFMCQGGNFTHYKSINGEKFDDENFIPKHTGPGILSNTDDSQFSSALPRLSGWRASIVLFSQVTDDMDVTGMEYYRSSNGKTSQKITIADCGQLEYI